MDKQIMIRSAVCLAVGVVIVVLVATVAFKNGIAAPQVFDACDSNGQCMHVTMSHEQVQNVLNKM